MAIKKIYFLKAFFKDKCRVSCISCQHVTKQTYTTYQSNLTTLNKVCTTCLHRHNDTNDDDNNHSHHWQRQAMTCPRKIPTVHPRSSESLSDSTGCRHELNSPCTTTKKKNFFKMDATETRHQDHNFSKAQTIPLIWNPMVTYRKKCMTN